VLLSLYGDYVPRVWMEASTVIEVAVRRGLLSYMAHVRNARRVPGVCQAMASHRMPGVSYLASAPRLVPRGRRQRSPADVGSSD